jgi:hypothetical protein
MPDATSIIATILRNHKDIASSMQAALAQLPKADSISGRPTPPASWAKLEGIDWSQDRAEFAAAVGELIRVAELPGNVRGLWANVPEIECNPAITYFTGHPAFDAADDAFEWTEEITWSSVPDSDDDEDSDDEEDEDQDEGGDAWLYELHALVQVQKALGFKEGGNPGPNADLCYAVPMAYVAFLLADVFAGVDRKLFPSKQDTIGVACTFPGGDGVVVGSLGARGWKPGV